MNAELAESSELAWEAITRYLAYCGLTESQIHAALGYIAAYGVAMEAQA